nr:TolC family protein [Mucilaginibacter sp. L294]
MKTISLRFAVCKPAITFLCLFFSAINCCFSQQISAGQRVIKLTLAESITLGKENNNLVKAAKSEESASVADYKDAKNAALPTILAGADYQRFTSLTLYNHFLGGAHSVPKRPTSNGADLNVAATLNLYSGGRQRAIEAEQSSKRDLSAVNTREQTANVGLQITAQYLGIVRLNDQKRFIEEQVIRAQTRLKNINALYQNQKVTRSDVLRAELVLSSVKLNLEAADNDIIITGQKLNVLLNLPDSVTIQVADSSNMLRPVVDTLLPLAVNAARDAFSVNKAGYDIQVQNARIRGIKSNNSPSLSLFSAYGFSYPNNIFYPPVDQAYSIGFVGLKIQYNISSIYQNKHKLSAGRIRLQELKYAEQNIKDDVKQEASGLLIKYREALNRIIVTQNSIEQARVNYKIVSAKYYNQLALLTDLLDADNLYQESRFNLVQAQTSAQFIYYQLLYTSGKL